MFTPTMFFTSPACDNATHIKLTTIDIIIIIITISVIIVIIEIILFDIIITIISCIILMNGIGSLGGNLHSAKGGAVETGCSELYDVLYCFTI